MEKTRKRPAPDTNPDDTRPARKNTEIQPVKKDDVALETYEQSPERPVCDERNRAATPDGPRRDKALATPE